MDPKDTKVDMEKLAKSYARHGANHIDRARNQGAASARNNIIAMIIGLQNDNGDPNSETYRAYQKVLETIIARHGDMFKPYKD